MKITLHKRLLLLAMFSVLLISLIWISTSAVYASVIFQEKLYAPLVFNEYNQIIEPYNGGDSSR